MSPSLPPDAAQVSSRSRLLTVFYSCALMAIFVVGFVANMRLNGVFSCPATHYTGDRYLGHCESTAYGDFDHGAVWFGLEPEVRRLAQAAEVLFVGNSRMQFGLSAPALGRYFAEEDLDYYLLGFSHGETVNFFSPLLRGLKPSARAYVVDADEFFTKTWTGPGRDVAQGQDAESRYRIKQRWQNVHRLACERMPWLCGHSMAFYRQRTTGEWSLAGNNVGAPADVDEVIALDEPRVAELRGPARDFVAQLGVAPQCVIFIYVPPRQSDRATIQALAQSLGVPFVSPEIAGLRTFDGSHLERESAQRFTSALVDELAPHLRSCLADTSSGSQR